MPPPPSPSPRTVALAGLVSLAVAMGIGRFAFTPLMPMMLSDGVIDLRAASWLASANYLGYVAGALLAVAQPWLAARWRPAAASPAVLVRAGLAATVLLTLAMALPWPAAWPALRFAAGVASAAVFVYTSGWCLARLATAGASALGGIVFAGPGAGIVLSGLLAGPIVELQWSAAAGWALFAVVAAGLGAAVWRTFSDPEGEPLRASALPRARPRPDEHRAERTLLAAAYGIAGFGYIVTATFLPVIARAALPPSPWLDAFWPLFGFGVMTGALLSTRLGGVGDPRWLLAVGYLMQAVGIALGLWIPTVAGFAVGSLLLGLPFTAISFFAMQEARRLAPESAPAFMGGLTALFGVGQAVGPPLVAVLVAGAHSPGEGFTLSLQVAAGSLVVGSAMYAAMARAFPVTRPAAA